MQDGKTALHLADEHGHVGVVQVLIGVHADLNLQDKVLYVCVMLWSKTTLCTNPPTSSSSLLSIFPFAPFSTTNSRITP